MCWPTWKPNWRRFKGGVESMSVTVCKEFVAESQEMRKAFCQTLIELAETNPDIVLLDADLMGAMRCV